MVNKLKAIRNLLEDTALESRDVDVYNPCPVCGNAPQDEEILNGQRHNEDCALDKVNDAYTLVGKLIREMESCEKNT